VSPRRFWFPEEEVTSQPFQAAPADNYEFVPISVAVLPGVSIEQLGQCQQIYQAALAQTRAALRPSWLERDVLGVWN
jgi:hypothetical protein